MRIDLTTEDDEFFDYCHYKYIPHKDYANKFRSVSLLDNSFGLMNIPFEFKKLVGLLQEKIGVKNTVWGVKKVKDALFWEFYFYNWKKKDPRIKISSILNELGDLFGFEGKIDETLPYFMFSIDIANEIFASKKIKGIHIYIGKHSYFFDGKKFRLENYYSFFSPKEQTRQIVWGIKNSAYVDFKKIKLKEILLPQLLRCKSICVAKKLDNDSVYYSGIDLSQFLYFLKKFKYPGKITEFVESNSGKLDHLQYDVGFDYKMEGGKLKILKSGYYGTF